VLDFTLRELARVEGEAVAIWRGGAMSTTQKLTQSLTIALEAFPEIRLAIVFGSIAREQVKRRSDVDLAVLSDTPLSSASKAALISALGRATSRPVDLIDLQRVGEPLLGEILKHGKRILVRDRTAYAALIRRHLFDAADFLPYRQRILEERRNRWIER